MLTVLILMGVARSQTVDADYYLASLLTPDDFEHLTEQALSVGDVGNEMWEEGLPIEVLRFDSNIRVDVSDAISIIRQGSGSYYFIDHAKKTVLAFPNYEKGFTNITGNIYACEVCPVWPESVGGHLSFGSLTGYISRARRSNEGILTSLVKASDISSSIGHETLIFTNEAPLGELQGTETYMFLRESIGTHTLIWSFQHEREDEDVAMWAIGYKSVEDDNLVPRAVKKQVSISVFDPPKDYEMLVDYIIDVFPDRAADYEGIPRAGISEQILFMKNMLVTVAFPK